MKKIILFFAITLLFTACNNEKTKENNYAEDNISDTLVYTYDSVKVYSKNFIKDKNGFSDSTKATITYPVFKNDTLNNYIERKVTAYISEEEKQISYQYLANSFVKGYDDFFSENKETFQNWFLMIGISVLNQKKDYIALQYLHSDYSGGAHPNTNFFFINYNLKSNQPITLDSLINQSQKLQLTTIGERIFRKNEKISAKANLQDGYFFENGKFYLPENFYISDRGLVFLYNPYEIKPYVAGITKLLIPFADLKNITKLNTILSSSN